MRWLLCAEGVLNVRGWNDNSKNTITALTMHTLPNNGIMLLYYSASCVPKRSMNCVKFEGNGHFPTLSSFLRVHGYIFAFMHACINKKTAKICAVKPRTWYHRYASHSPLWGWSNLWRLSCYRWCCCYRSEETLGCHPARGSPDLEGLQTVWRSTVARLWPLHEANRVIKMSWISCLND